MSASRSKSPSRQPRSDKSHLFPGHASSSPHLPEPSLAKNAGIRGGNTDRHDPRTESPMFPSYSGSPGKRLTTLPEVWDAMMEEQPSNERDSSVPRRIPHVQIQGGDIWRQYDTNAKTLENDLHNFHDKVQELGSSLDIARAARKTQECLRLVSWFVRENAKSLFPLVVNSIDVPQLVNELYTEESKPSPRWPPDAASSTNLVPNYKMGLLHNQLLELSQNVEILRGTLEQFSEFNNLGKRPLAWFESDLKYWSSCLERYDGQYDIHEVQVYVHDLSSELGKRFKEVSQHINEYTAYIPNVRLAQQHTMSNQQTLATIATFFSAVTATTIQYAVGIGDTRTLSRIVLALWFTSLVFSIASALNTSIALIWRSATYAPEMQIPSWLWIWIRQCPVIFLLVSVVTFLAGLACFAASTQPRVTWVIVLVCEGISSFTVAALLLLLVADKWSSYRLQEQPKPRRLSLARIFGEKTGNVLPTHIQHGASWSVGYLSRASEVLGFIAPRLEFASSRQPEEVPSDIMVSPHPEPLPQVHHKAPSRRSSTLPPMQRLWRRTIRKVILLSRATQANAEWGMHEADRMTALESHIRNISAVAGAIHHEAGPETSDIDFHPEGTSLAICGKRLTLRCEIGSSVGKIDELRHYVGQARQVIWLTSGQLLTRTSRAVHVWTLSPEIRRTKTITRYESSNFILSIPNMKSNILPRFLSVEGIAMNKLCLLDTNGDEHMTYEFDSFSIHHADVVPEGSCVLLAVEVTQGVQGVRPMKASPARKLMVFNIEEQEIEHDVPLWHEVQHVTISGNGQMAIVTYKGYPPPQLWLLRRTLDGIRLRLDRQFCAREHRSAMEYNPMQSVRFSGKGHFLHKDRFIICTTAEGKIHFWRRDKSNPVHVLGGLATEEDWPMQISCNRAREDFTFATRSQDGTVRIWKTQDEMGGTDQNALGLSTQPLHLSESPQMGQLTELPEDTVAEGEMLDTKEPV